MRRGAGGGGMTRTAEKGQKVRSGEGAGRRGVFHGVQRGKEARRESDGQLRSIFDRLLRTQ